MIRIETNSQVFDVFLKDEKKNSEWLKSQLMALDKPTLEYVRDYIIASKKRDDKITATTGKLEEVLDIDEKFDTEFIYGWGIGDINKLTREAAHWAALNYGSDHIIGMSVPGQFAGAGPNDAFVYSPGSNNFMVPSKGITAINYIEITNDELIHWVDDILRNYSRI